MGPSREERINRIQEAYDQYSKPGETPEEFADRIGPQRTTYAWAAHYFEDLTWFKENPTDE